MTQRRRWPALALAVVIVGIGGVLLWAMRSVPSRPRNIASSAPSSPLAEPPPRTSVVAELPPADDHHLGAAQNRFIGVWRYLTAFDRAWITLADLMEGHCVQSPSC